MGVDTGTHAALRRRLDDRSQRGLDASRRFLTDALERISRVQRDELEPSVLTSLAVAQNAFRTALDGMDLPYGVATIGSWRNTPYGVIQNVGGYLDIPQLLDGDQPVRNHSDAEDYVARLAATPALLDGELERIRAARSGGLVPPDFLLDKTIRALTPRASRARGSCPRSNDSWQRFASSGRPPAPKRD